MKRTILVPLAAIVTIAAASTAAAETAVSAGWRLTERKAYVFPGSSDEQVDLPDLVRDDGVDVGVRNSHREWARFEGEFETSVGTNLAVGARMAGGRFRLKVAENQPLADGQDYTWDATARWTTTFGSGFDVDTVVGARVRKWWFEGGRLPSHGNVGLILGVRPSWGGASLLVESTLAAAWLQDLNSWGAQKDSSILRIRPQYELDVGTVRPFAALEYYHTHTEFFGSKLVAEENALMIDDFDLAAIVGARYVF